MVETKEKNGNGTSKVLAIALTAALAVISALAFALHTTARAQIDKQEVRIIDLEKQRAADLEWQKNVMATLGEIKADVKDLKK